MQSEKNAPVNEKAVEDMSGAVIEYVRGIACGEIIWAGGRFDCQYEKGGK